MQILHNHGEVNDLLRAFFVVLEEGSLNRAATRLHLSQPSLSRQMQALEQQLGAPLLERHSSGVQPTALGQLLADKLKPILASYDTAIADLRRAARGQLATLRIGYIGSAGARYLNPALARLRHAHPEAKLKLLDLTPGEQIAALRRGEIDLALIGQEGASIARDFYTRKLATLGVCVAVPADHRLAAGAGVAALDLQDEVFVGAPEAEVPGRMQWINKICRKAGFRPKFIGEADSIGEAFSMVASEGAVTLLPDYFLATPPPGTALLPLLDPSATWDLLLIWQRGRAPKVLRTMIELITQTAQAE